MAATHIQHAQWEDPRPFRLLGEVEHRDFLISQTSAGDTGADFEDDPEPREKELSSKDITSRPHPRLEARRPWKSNRITLSAGKGDIQRKQDPVLPLIKCSQSPSMLLELDADEGSSMLPCDLPSGVVKRHLHNSQ